MSVGPPEKENPVTKATSLEDAGILVVDDDPAFQLGLKTFLREYAGFGKVFTARNGQEALDLIASEPSISVITLDNEMPEMTGMEMLKKLGETAPHPLSVVMITGQSSSKLEKQFRKFESPHLITDHYLTKPIPFEDLEPVILESYRKLQSLPAPDEPDLKELLSEDGSRDDAEVVAPTAPISPTSSVNNMLAELQVELRRNTDAVNALQGRIPTIEERFWLSILKIITLAVLVWMAVQLDGIDHAKKWLNHLENLTGSARVEQKQVKAEAADLQPEKQKPTKKSVPPPIDTTEKTEKAFSQKVSQKVSQKKEKTKPGAGGFQPVTGPVEPSEKEAKTNAQ